MTALADWTLARCQACGHIQAHPRGCFDPLYKCCDRLSDGIDLRGVRNTTDLRINDWTDAAEAARLLSIRTTESPSSTQHTHT
jgi:hypothetical protein